PLEAGKPSPEGIHQDGADYVFIMLLDRENVSGASNTIHNKSGGVIYEATLKQSGEAILIDDKRHWHGVSKVLQDDKNLESHRDVLVLTFHKEA
ncbi:MAG: 2OG-Fe dioxygenase family protein, partial [Thiotrichaceae bacterium]